MKNVGTLKIESKRLILRRFERSDGSDMLKYWVSDERVQPAYGEPVYTTESEVDELLGKYISAYESGNCFRWAIIEKKSKICIGQIAFFLVDASISDVFSET